MDEDMDQQMDQPTEQRAESAQELDTRVLQRTAEHLIEHWAGVFAPELVERMVFESYAALACTAKVRTYLAPLAGHFAADRLTALAHTRTRDQTSVPQVLFVDEEDTSRSQIAAALLIHYARGAVVARSAGFTAGDAVDPLVLEKLADRGITTEGVYPKPVTDDVVRAADHVITFGASDGIHVHPGTAQEHWTVGGLPPGTTPERVGEVVEAIDTRVKELLEQIRTATPSPAATASPRTG